MSGSMGLSLHACALLSCCNTNVIRFSDDVGSWIKVEDKLETQMSALGLARDFQHNEFNNNNNDQVFNTDNIHHSPASRTHYQLTKNPNNR